MPDPDWPQSAWSQSQPPTRLLVVLTERDPATLETLAAKVRETFSNLPVTLAVPGAKADPAAGSGSERVTYQAATASPAAWILRAADFVNAFQLMREQEAQGALLLSASALSVEPQTLRALAEPVLRGQADLVMPGYRLPDRPGRLTAAVLYPLTSSLFLPRIRVPLPIDLCLSPRAAERLATAAQRFTAAREPDAIVWPVLECAVAGYHVIEVAAGKRDLPEAPEQELTSTLVQLTQSLFTAIDARAGFWQRSRVTAGARPLPPAASLPGSVPEEVTSLLHAFCSGFATEHETWSEVLPPHTLLGLKRLSEQHAKDFLMTDALWTRIVFDFLLAWRLRTVERTQLLKSLGPLYRAWVASNILALGAEGDPERGTAALAHAFEVDRPYLIARWRWPDRFNP